MKQKLFFSVICVFFAFAANAQITRYVRINGTTLAANAQNATSWASACNDLQAVIDSSQAGDQVWVAAGTYKRNNGQGNSFIMKEGVDVYGGFPVSGSPTMADRTLPTAQSPVNQTILDGQGFQSLIVLRVLLQPTAFSVPTVWDGFVIQNGQRRNGSGDANLRGNGAGAYLRKNGELRNCVLKNNINKY